MRTPKMDVSQERMYVNGGQKLALTAFDASRALLAGEFVEGFPLGHVLGGVETLAALAAAVRAIGQKEQNPKF